jgi:uncharacterized membrane protein YeaQ/YmgE (transglycosylase-associated protein family)
MSDEYMGRLGERGTFLLIFAIIEITRGYQTIVTPALRLPGVTVIHDAIPIPWYGLMWVICGLAGGLFAFTTTPGRDRYGYIIQMIPTALTALSYVGSWVISFIPGQMGDPRGWASSILFWGLFALIYHGSGRAEPQRRLPIEELVKRGHNGR